MGIEIWASCGRGCPPADAGGTDSLIGCPPADAGGTLDALLNASMILSGMGPMAIPGTEGGKIFASIYALYSGFAVLVIAGIAFGPVLHRLFHRLHIDESDFPTED